jgi:hypothetical protein
MVDLLAYLLGKQGVRDAMFLPVLFTSLILEKSVYYNHK